MKRHLRVSRSKKKWTAATVGVAVIGTLAAAVALGSPGSGVAVTTLVTANFDDTANLNSDGVKFQTQHATDVRIQRFVFAPGAYTGWHHHPGLVLVSVETGAVSRWDSDCSSETFGPGLPNGAVFLMRGDDPMQVTSTDGATVYVTYVVPSADPPVFRIEDVPPHCA